MIKAAAIKKVKAYKKYEQNVRLNDVFYESLNGVIKLIVENQKYTEQELIVIRDNFQEIQKFFAQDFLVKQIQSKTYIETYVHPKINEHLAKLHGAIKPDKEFEWERSYWLTVFFALYFAEIIEEYESCANLHKYLLINFTEAYVTDYIMALRNGEI